MTDIRGGDLSNQAVLKSLSRLRAAKLRLDRPTSLQSTEATLLSQIALCDVLLDEIQSIACSLKRPRPYPGEPTAGRNRARLWYRSSNMGCSAGTRRSDAAFHRWRRGRVPSIDEAGAADGSQGPPRASRPLAAESRSLPKLRCLPGVRRDP